MRLWARTSLAFALLALTFAVGHDAPTTARYSYDRLFRSSFGRSFATRLEASAGDRATGSDAVGRPTGQLAPLRLAAEGSATELAGVGSGPGAAHIGDPAFSAASRVIAETEAAGAGNITSSYSLGSSEALQAGEDFLGEGYTELGKPGSGVFRSADNLRQFRIDPRSLQGLHDPYVPHVHFELFPDDPFSYVNNHVPFYED